MTVPRGWTKDTVEVLGREGRPARMEDTKRPPVHKPFKQKQCVWVTGIGWVFNPGNRWFER